jgi:anti-sigma-K factor RskA
MRYDDPRLLSLLAGEYVLGTLTLRARRRFERLMAARPAARRHVEEWQERLAPIDLTLAPVAPPARVWQRIAGQLGFTPDVPRPSLWQRLGLWRAIAATFAVLAIALGIERTIQAPRVQELEQQAANARRLEGELAASTSEAAKLRDEFDAARTTLAAPVQVAVVAQPDGKPLWLVKLSERSLRVTAVGTPADQPGKSYELWMLPDGGSPVSLGILPAAGEASVTLSDAQFAALARTPAIAVSLEPAGGSPTGLPTGPVLYTAPLVRG